MSDGPFRLCFSSRKLGDAARTWVARKMWVVIQKIRGNDTFYFPATSASALYSKCDGKWANFAKSGQSKYFVAVFTSIWNSARDFCRALRRQCGFQSFLGKVQNLFPENILTKGNLTMTQKWGFAHWILLFLSKMEFSLIVEHSFVF